jgi:hypothetical protein
VAPIEHRRPHRHLLHPDPRAGMNEKRPHGWALLKKTNKDADLGPGQQADGQWHNFLYITATDINGEPDRGFSFAKEHLEAARQANAESAAKRGQPIINRFMLMECRMVEDEVTEDPAQRHLYHEDDE